MDKEDLTKKYTNGEITVVWKPAACIHSTICWKGETGLVSVFDPRERPWIKLQGAPTNAITEQVNKCPSGALSYYLNNKEEEHADTEVDARVEITPNGPLMVYGNIAVKDQHGNETKKYRVTAFCRCGLSSNKPYCDGSHIKTRIDG